MVKQAAGATGEMGAGSPAQPLATAGPGLPHGLAGTGPSLHRGPWLGVLSGSMGPQLFLGSSQRNHHWAGAEGALWGHPGPWPPLSCTSPDHLRWVASRGEPLAL